MPCVVLKCSQRHCEVQAGSPQQGCGVVVSPVARDWWLKSFSVNLGILQSSVGVWYQKLCIFQRKVALNNRFNCYSELCSELVSQQTVNIKLFQEMSIVRKVVNEKIQEIEQGYQIVSAGIWVKGDKNQVNDTLRKR